MIDTISCSEPFRKWNNSMNESRLFDTVPICISIRNTTIKQEHYLSSLHAACNIFNFNRILPSQELDFVSCRIQVFWDFHSEYILSLSATSEICFWASWLSVDSYLDKLNFELLIQWTSWGEVLIYTLFYVLLTKTALKWDISVAILVSQILISI